MYKKWQYEAQYMWAKPVFPFNKCPQPFRNDIHYQVSKIELYGLLLFHNKNGNKLFGLWLKQTRTWATMWMLVLFIFVFCWLESLKLQNQLDLQI